MSDIQTLIRNEAARLLEEKIVDVVVGFKTGTVPLHPQPVFITRLKTHKTWCWMAFAKTIWRTI